MSQAIIHFFILGQIPGTNVYLSFIDLFGGTSAAVCFYFFGTKAFSIAQDIARLKPAHFRSAILKNASVNIPRSAKHQTA